MSNNGLLQKKRQREEAEIPTSSMADIAFLLLIFFLVTTTINVDTGIGMTLPPKLEDQQQPPPVKERNMLKILVNGQGDVLLEGEQSNVQQIRDEVKKHITNYGQDPNYGVSPDLAVVSIKTDAQTPYRIYVNVLDEAWMAYREIWNGIAQSNRLPNGKDAGIGRTYPSYDAYKAALSADAGKGPIREAVPAKISIAEPDTGE
jgi:biopolymer transport protein ExbD